MVPGAQQGGDDVTLNRSKHDPVIPGQDGAPELVRRERTAAERTLDRAARRFYGSEAPGGGGKNVIDASQARGIEYGAALSDKGELGKTVMGKTDEVAIPTFGKGHTAAIFHTHPGMVNGEYFSWADISAARSVGAPIYLATPQEILLVYAPGGNTIMNLGAVLPSSLPQVRIPGTVELPSIPIR